MSEAIEKLEEADTTIIHALQGTDSIDWERAMKLQKLVNQAKAALKTRDKEVVKRAKDIIRHLEHYDHFSCGGCLQNAEQIISLLQPKCKKLEEKLKDKERLDWLDLHTAFVADGEYLIGPYKKGELRKMADDGLAADKANQDQPCQTCGGEKYRECNVCQGNGIDDDGQTCTKCKGNAMIPCPICGEKGD